jgi:anthranilate phosphoribosyltransferase
MCGCGGNVNREAVTSQQLAAQLAAAEEQRIAASGEESTSTDSLVAAVANASGD